MARGTIEKKTYLTFQSGKVVERVPQGTPNAVSRVLQDGPNAGKTIWERRDDFVEGMLVSIKKEKSNDFGWRWKITIVDEEEACTIELPYSSGYAKALLFAIEGANLSVPIKFVPKMTTKDGKNKHYLNLYQAPYNESLKWNYTKDSPNGIPQMKQIKVKGVDVWDDSEQLEFLEKMLESKIIPNLKSQGEAELEMHQPTYAEHVQDVSEKVAEAKKSKTVEKPEPVSFDGADDLPF